MSRGTLAHCETSQCWGDALGGVSMEVLFLWKLFSMLVYQHPTQLILVRLKGLSFHSGFTPKEDRVLGIRLVLE